jgi:uncharacterized protein GlcG (DUF336 family)
MLVACVIPVTNESVATVMTDLYTEHFDAAQAGTNMPYVNTLDVGPVASPGGFLIIEGGKRVGTIGCSGGTVDQDAAM